MLGETLPSDHLQQLMNDHPSLYSAWSRSSDHESMIVFVQLKNREKRAHVVLNIERIVTLLILVARVL